MNISLKGVGKKYRKQWVFKNIDLQLTAGRSYAITGANGSGKSTLLKIISGFVLPSEGEVAYLMDGKDIAPDVVYNQVSMAAPYLDVPDEFDLEEAIKFHYQFKKIAKTRELHELPALFQLDHALKKPVKAFSTGMKQRLKVGLALMSECPILLLDEPASNLDKNGVNWYIDLVKHLDLTNKILVICSNRAEEYEFCSEVISIEDYK